MAKTGLRRTKKPQVARRATAAKAHSRRRVTFRLEAESGSSVYVAGSFNAWDPKKHPLKADDDGSYSAKILLRRGSHEYKFIVDDVWCVDPTCPDWTPNGMGSLNSVMTIL